MIESNEYIDFKNRSRIHLGSTLDSFEFWGRTVGRIDGQIKAKWGEARWYANLDAPNSLYDLVDVGEYSSKYKWDPTESFGNKVLDVLNNMSKFFHFMLYIFVLYRLFFYNVAYWVAIAKNPMCASDIVSAADNPSKIVFGRSFAAFIRKRHVKK